ncbi:MAG: trypsin-like peptidase domain-containing protein [Chloroflexota bacterium]
MAKGLQTTSDELAALVQESSPGIVRVEGRRRAGATGIVWSADGFIITANHVVRRDSQIGVGLPDGEVVEATLIGRDQTTDVALLKIEATGLTPFTSAAESEMTVGHLVLALGRPGKTVQATLGIVSALGSSWRTGMGGEVDHYLQTDVVMYPGFSGGPLVGANGHLLGMNTSGFGQGVSLAIPSATLARVADSLQSHGKIRRGYLGVSTQRVRLPEDIQAELAQRSGLLIVDVEAESPAAEGGLTLGDTIVGISDRPVRTHDDLLAALSGDVVDQKEMIRILRGGKLEEVAVKIGERG